MTLTDAGAKAAGIIAETAGKGIDAAREAGGFLREVFGPALVEAGATMHDRVQLFRAERLARLRPRFEAARQQLGFHGPLNRVPFKFGIPYIEAASLEEDEVLLDMFATLLANATEGIEQAQRRAMVTILEQMSRLDAKVLLSVYNAPPADPRAYPMRTVYTAELPEKHTVTQSGGRVVEPRFEVTVALWNLARLGCIEPAGLWDGAASIGVVTLTTLGIALVDNATLPEQRTFVPPDPALHPPYP